MTIHTYIYITAQPGPVIYSFYATACNPPGGYVKELELWNLKAEGTTRLRIVGLADETELVSLAIR